MSRWFPPALLLIIAVALAFRLPDLDRRPMHNDEGVNAIKFRSLWEKNSYRYDPKEFHGPTLPYGTLPSVWLNSSRDFAQFDETVFRLVPVAFGVGLILLLFLLADGLGKAETLCAGVLTALSPAMVYYSRYYIHEMLLVFATALVLAAGWRYTRTGKAGWCLLIGLGIGLMHATKETFVFAVFALGAAVAGEMLWERRIERRAADFKRYFRWQHASLALLVAVTISLVFFTSLFTNANGPIDSLKTYSTWINRAGGDSPHTQPWFFYFRRLLFFHYAKGPYWSEALILILATAGTVGALNRRRLTTANPALVRTIEFYSIILASIYTVLPYKTPWCALGFWHGTILLAGVGAVEIARRCRPGWQRFGVVTALAAGTIHLGWQAWQASFVFGASQLNPYVYAHTSPDVLKLVSKISDLSRFSPDGHRTVVKVMSPANDYWPLPWYLRQFPNVGWWGQVPQDPLAPIMIVASKFEAAFDARPDKTHLMAGYFQLRPQVFLELYVEVNLWRAYVKSLPPEKD
jgi:uncharacterized protein (TIGR03663 family)